MTNPKGDAIFVVDANAIDEFYQEKILDSSTAISDAIGILLSRGYIVIDDKDWILTEWNGRALRGDDTLMAWIDMGIQEKWIRLLPFKQKPHLRKKLQQLGMPNDDLKYVIFADHLKGKAIITDDIDFHEPKEKNNRKPGKIDSIKASKKGSVCKYITKKLSINVLNWQEASVKFKA
ncbi:MAG: hypothetical protein K8R48_08510 [Alphaproteobacteria bacterium]|nr:hypothetical protein [Alphaproteobacteria bacterium]